MARVYSDAGEELAWIAEEFLIARPEIETCEVAVFCEDGGGAHCEYCAEKGNEETLRYTRDARTWELAIREVTDA